MFRNVCFRSAFLFALTNLAGAPTSAGDYTFDVPEFRGTYSGSSPVRSVELDLGMSFAQINGASLQLTGSHQPGSYGDLNSAGIFPYPAEIIGQFPEAGPTFTTAFDTFLPAAGGPFDQTFVFQNLRAPHGSEPSFEHLLDGKARLDLSASGGFLLAIYYIVSQPEVVIESATLIIDGQPDLDAFMILGDYNGDRIVDHGDYEVWKTAMVSTSDLMADGNRDGRVDAADYTIWRGAMHDFANGAGAHTVGTPEPSGMVLAMICASAGALCYRRGFRTIVERGGSVTVIDAGRPWLSRGRA